MSILEMKGLPNMRLGSTCNEKLEWNACYPVEDGIYQDFYQFRCRTFIKCIYDNDILGFLFRNGLGGIYDEGPELF